MLNFKASSYNSLAKSERNIYNVVTKANDTIDLVFGDGNFSSLPLGTFRVYTRTSDNAQFSIQPGDMTNVQIVIPYEDKNGAEQSLTMSMSLQSSVYNSAATESNESIKSCNSFLEISILLCTVSL